jgi:hypothetical protein
VGVPSPCTSVIASAQSKLQQRALHTSLAVLGRQEEEAEPANPKSMLNDLQ